VYAVSSAGVVVAIDPTTYRVTATAPTGAKPAHVIEAPNGKVYVSNSGDGTVSVYQAPGLSPAGRITLGGMPHGLRAAAGGSVIVVANTMDGALDLIDPAADKYVGAVPVGPGPAQVAVSADGKFAYTGISDPPSVVKVDLAQREIVGSAIVPNSPVQLYLTPYENEVVSADQGRKDAQGQTLSVIDTKAMTTRGTVTTGAGPHGVVIDASGDWAWVTNSFDNTVTAVDLTTLSAMAPIPVGTQPSDISYSPHPPAAAWANVGTLDIPTPSAPPEQESQPGPHSGHH
jgi:YVTN family beta-propeller protein